MATTKIPVNSAPTVENSPPYDDLFGTPALITGDNAAQYAELLEQMRENVNPTDLLEEMWLRDIVDHIWETLRLRRLKAQLITAGAHQGLERVLKPLVGWPHNEHLAEAWAKRDRQALKQVDKLLVSAGLTMETVVAETLVARLDDVERIDHMIAMTEALRAGALRGLERHRAALAEAPKRLAQQVEDAEFEDVKAPAAIRAVA